MKTLEKETVKTAEEKKIVTQEKHKPFKKEDKTAGFWRTLFPYMKPFRKNIIVAVFLSLITGVCVSLQPLVIKYVVDSGISGAPFVLFGKTVPIGDPIIFIAILAGAYVLFSLGRIYTWRYGYKNILKLQEGTLFNLRSTFFGHVQRMCMHFRDKNSSGELYNYIMGAPMANIKSFLASIFQSVPYQAISLVISLVLLISYNLYLTLIVVGAAFVMAFFNRRSRKKIREVSRSYLDAEKQTSHYVSDALQGGEATKMYAIEDASIAAFDQRLNTLRMTGIRAPFTNIVEAAKPEIVQYVCTALVYFVGGLFCLRGEIQVGELYLFISTMGTIFSVIIAWLNLFFAQSTAAVALERIDAIIAEHSTTPEVAADSRRSVEIEKASAIRHGKPCIAFHNVDFAYGDKLVFENLSCELKYGESLALVGGSGSGKSTFTKLVMRLYEVNGGEVLLHDRNVKDYATHDLRLSFGVVPQNPYIFHGTVWDNIRIVRPDASNLEIIKAMEVARVHEFVNDLPRGWSTLIGDGALGLSGGQKQRIAIARAILKNPDIFIFDEATSALDNVSERLIQEAMEELMQSHTVIFVAHRLSTIRNVNRILVFDHGEIVEEGNYDTLAAGNGVFRQLLDAAEGKLARFENPPKF
ncbi:MAG: ABC transporter ATP-binding protein [Ruminococcaceae bacterium]|nr:ABC transporter ATP-binding protein [Oscillospiraceae bacterium]